MSNIFLSDLQEKEIISIETVLNYGHIVDAQISSDGKIISFVAESKKMGKRLSNGSCFRKVRVAFCPWK